VVEVTGDPGGSRGDAFADGQDGPGWLGTEVTAGPGGRGRKLVCRRDAAPDADDVGDRVGFGLRDPGAAGGGGAGRAADGFVQQDVAELVGQCPDDLVLIGAGRDPDAAGRPHCYVVLGTAVRALDRESLAPG